MYALTNFGNAELQSMRIRRVNPAPAVTHVTTEPWVPNLDPATSTKRVPEQPKSARVFHQPIVLDGTGSGSEWEIRATVVAHDGPALLVITLIHETTRAKVSSFRAKSVGPATTTAVRFKE